MLDERNRDPALRMIPAIVLSELADVEREVTAARALYVAKRPGWRSWLEHFVHWR